HHRGHPPPPTFPTRRSSDLLEIGPTTSSRSYLETMESMAFLVSGQKHRAYSFGKRRTAVRWPQAPWRWRESRSGCGYCGRDFVRDRKSTRLNSSHVKISYGV